MNTGNTWPEQDAVLDWWNKHNHELKEVVSEYRINIQANIQTCLQCGRKYWAKSHEYPCPWCELAKRELEIEELRSDKNRLDYLEQRHCAVGYNVEVCAWGVEWDAPFGKTIREAIDNAIEEHDNDMREKAALKQGELEA